MLPRTLNQATYTYKFSHVVLNSKIDTIFYLLTNLCTLKLTYG